MGPSTPVDSAMTAVMAAMARVTSVSTAVTALSTGVMTPSTAVTALSTGVTALSTTLLAQSKTVLAGATRVRWVDQRCADEVADGPGEHDFHGGADGQTRVFPLHTGHTPVSVYLPFT